MICSKCKNNTENVGLNPNLCYYCDKEERSKLSVGDKVIIFAVITGLALVLLCSVAMGVMKFLALLKYLKS
jgi:hypothetical protein